MLVRDEFDKSIKKESIQYMPKHKSYIGGNETQFGYEKKIQYVLY